MHIINDERWDELTRSADAVRVVEAEERPLRSRWRRVVVRGAYMTALTALTAAALHAAANAPTVHADGSADGALFSLTNQDRSSNGVRSVTFNGTLSTIGEGGGYGGCGFHVSGRSVDMIQRNYFAHPILGCGQLVFSMMRAYGIGYQSAGENIGWNTIPSGGSAAGAVNTAFMNSPDHRANILNPNYTDLGTGSDNSGSSAWTGGGGSYTNAWMFAEEFAQLGSSPPPPPPSPPPPPPTPRPQPGGGGGPVRNTPAPAAPSAPGASTSTAPPGTPGATPASAPTGTPVSTPLPTVAAGLPLPTAIPGLTVAPGSPESGGLLFDSVESVLESYLIS